jgi:hypothetical protein
MAKRISNKAQGTTKAAKPWQNQNPKGPGEHKQLTSERKAIAKRRAKAAGRPYPNLVDNMRAGAESKK